MTTQPTAIWTIYPSNQILVGVRGCFGTGDTLFEAACGFYSKLNNPPVPVVVEAKTTQPEPYKAHGKDGYVQHWVNGGWEDCPAYHHGQPCGRCPKVEA